jgi:hypothetical protein
MSTIRDEWVKIGGTVDCRAIVHYHEGTDGWEAWPVRGDLTVKNRRASAIPLSIE